MNKIFACLLALLVSGCSGCAHTPLSDDGLYGGGGREEQSVQHIMKQAVGVRVKLSIPDIGDDGKTKLGARWSSGSGTVVRYDRKTKRSLVLTAAHVCQPPDLISIEAGKKEIEVPVLWSNFFVLNHKGERLLAIPLVVSAKADVCILEVDGWAGEVATIATSLPPRGARLVTSGSPRGAWGKGFVPYQEGIYFGLQAGIDDDHPDSVLLGTSIPGVGGMSGSGVYYNGRLVGVLISVMNNYEHFSYLVNSVDVYDLLVQADKKWQKSPKSTFLSPN